MDVFGPGLGALDALSVIAFAGLYFAALRNRGQVQLPARYLLVTPLLLLAPNFTRLFVGHVPGLAINGPEDMVRFVYSLHLANAIALAMAVTLYARPFLVAAALIVLHRIAFQWLGFAPWWREFYASLGSLPTAVPVALRLAAGVAIVNLGGAARGLRRPAGPCWTR